MKPGLLAACVAASLALLLAVAPRGTPGSPYAPRAWEGLGPHLDARLPGLGQVVFQRVRATGRDEHLIEVVSSLGGELASTGLYLLALPAAAVWVQRRAPLPLGPRRQDLDPLLTALAWLVPLFCLVGLGLAFAAAHVDGGRPLRTAVYGFCLPPLGRPDTAALPVLRMVVLAPLVEELVWRGIVYRGLRSRLSFGPASLLAAFLFGLWHVLTGWDDPPALAAQYTFGLVACWLVERTGGLGGPILLHALGNALAVGLYLTCMLAPEQVLGLFGVA